MVESTAISPHIGSENYHSVHLVKEGELSFSLLFIWFWCSLLSLFASSVSSFRSNNYWSTVILFSKITKIPSLPLDLKTGITMSAFIKLEDSPMFQKQVTSDWIRFNFVLISAQSDSFLLLSLLLLLWQLFSMEESADELKDRCQRLYKGCKKFTCVTRSLCFC